MQLLPTPESPKRTNFIRKFLESDTPELSRLEPRISPDDFPGVEAEHPMAERGLAADTTRNEKDGESDAEFIYM